MNNILIVILGICFIFLMTTLGASLVFLFKNKSGVKNIAGAVMGLASGIMISASIWSLLLPAFEYVSEDNAIKTIIVVLVFMIGGVLIGGMGIVFDKNAKHLKTTAKNCKNKGLYTNNGFNLQLGKTKKTTKLYKLFWAVTLHNIPEGLAVGIAFGNALTDSTIGFASAIMLCFGIGIQNFPEGLAVAMPIKSETKSSKNGFVFGMLSGVVEPIFSVLGIIMASSLPIIMPYLLAFSAGAMIYVVVSELITDKSYCANNSLGAWFFMFGFAIMTIMDLLL